MLLSITALAPSVGTKDFRLQEGLQKKDDPKSEGLMTRTLNKWKASFYYNASEQDSRNFATCMMFAMAVHLERPIVVLTMSGAGSCLANSSTTVQKKQKSAAKANASRLEAVVLCMGISKEKREGLKELLARAPKSSPLKYSSYTRNSTIIHAPQIVLASSMSARRNGEIGLLLSPQHMDMNGCVFFRWYLKVNGMKSARVSV